MYSLNKTIEQHTIKGSCVDFYLVRRHKVPGQLACSWDDRTPFFAHLCLPSPRLGLLPQWRTRTAGPESLKCYGAFFFFQLKNSPLCRKALQAEAPGKLHQDIPHLKQTDGSFPPTPQKRPSSDTLIRPIGGRYLILSGEVLVAPSDRREALTLHCHWLIH